MKYFLSSTNVVYVIVIDISTSLSNQHAQVQHWMRYLSTQLKKIESVPIIVIGNKSDLVKEEELQVTISYLSSLTQNHSIQYVITSAAKSTNVKSLLDILRDKCTILLGDKEYFMVPHIYKRIGEHIKQRRNRGEILLGNLAVWMTRRFFGSYISC